MLKSIIKHSLFPVLILALFLGCSQNGDNLLNSVDQAQTSAKEKPQFQTNDFGPLPKAKMNLNFEHGIVVDVDGKDYYLAGAPDGPNGATDVPGHSWYQRDPKRLIGKHYNTGPFGASKWWSSNAEDGQLLYMVYGIIDTWTPKKAKMYYRRGFTHYHEFLAVDDKKPHPTKIIWLKHIAVDYFTLDGGPHPETSHEVEPGVDREFIPNWDNPYMPNSHHN